MSIRDLFYNKLQIHYRATNIIISLIYNYIMYVYTFTVINIKVFNSEKFNIFIECVL